MIFKVEYVILIFFSFFCGGIGSFLVFFFFLGSVLRVEVRFFVLDEFRFFESLEGGNCFIRSCIFRGENSGVSDSVL